MGGMDLHNFGVATFSLSGWQYGKLIKSEDCGFVNSYDPKEATCRLHRFFRQARQRARTVTLEGAVVVLGGAMVAPAAGLPRDASNELVEAAAAVLATELRSLRDTAGDVFVPCVAAPGSADIAFYHALQALLANDLGIQLRLQQGMAPLDWKVYETSFSARAFHQATCVVPTSKEGVTQAGVDYRVRRGYDGIDILTQSPLSLALPGMGLVITGPMTGAERAQETVTTDWHVMISMPGCGVERCHAVSGVPAPVEDIEHARTLPPISFSAKDCGAVPGNKVVSIRFG